MKKLTAGIFTALLGLVTVNAANAAIPSTTYVDTKITTAQEAAQDYADAQDAALKSTIETAYKAADTTLDGKITANANAISEMDTAYKAADTTLSEKIGSVDFEGKLSSDDLTAAVLEVKAIADAASGDITALGSLASKSVVTNAELDANLQATVAQVATNKTNIESNDADILDLQGRMTTAEGEIETLTGSGEGSVAKAEADANAYTDSAIANLATVYDAAGSAAAAETRAKAHAESEADAAQSAAETYAKNYADGLNTTATAAIEANAAAIGSNDTDIANLQSKDTELAGLISGNTTEIAKKADATATTQALATKAAKDGYTASQVVITDSTGAIATAAQISNTQVSGLGDLATKSTIADADVAANAEIAQSKIAGLEDALANTTPKVTARGEAGTYVLTAIVSDSGATSYQWEQIERPTTGGEG